MDGIAGVEEGLVVGEVLLGHGQADSPEVEGGEGLEDGYGFEELVSLVAETFEFGVEQQLIGFLIEVHEL